MYPSRARTPIGSLATSRPQTSIRPSVGLEMPNRSRNMVVLPAPLAPTRPTNPRGRSMVRSSSAVTPGYRLVRPSMRRREFVTTTTTSLPRRDALGVALADERAPGRSELDHQATAGAARLEDAVGLAGLLRGERSGD